VILVHNVLPFHPGILTHESVLKRLRLRLLAVLTRYFIRNSAGTIFLSRSGRQACLSDGRTRPRMESVIYHGVDHDFGRGITEDAGREILHRYGVDGPFLLAVSHLYRYKNVHVLIEALSRMSVPGSSPHRLVVAGAPYDAGYAREIRQLSSRLGVSDRVHFIGARSQEELSALHASASVVTFLSSCDNCPMSLLEALASGRPLLASDRSVVPEIVDDAGLLVDPGDTEAVVDAVQRLISSESLRLELGDRAKRRSRLFDWKTTASKTLEFLERVAVES
jgi:glycosyltransferase involved in cell wall biosynthesis